MSQKDRASSFELLRILCIYGIISMHVFGSYLERAVGADRVYLCFVNTVFNMGVSIFMLVSGYFGIKFSVRKMVKLMAPVMVYAMAGTLISFQMKQYFSAKELVNAIFAVFVNKYWFATSYIIIFMLSGYINKLLQSLERPEYRRLLFILVVFFVVAPTLLMEPKLYNGGKNVLHLLLMYVVGRYIGLYDITLGKAKSSLFAILSLGVLFSVTLCLSLIYKGKGGAVITFCTDNSICIFLGSVFTFLFFKNISFKSRLVNLIAASVFATYLFEGTVRKLIGSVFNHETLGIGETPYNIVLPIIVILVVFVVERIRVMCFSKFEEWVVKKLSSFGDKTSAPNFF